MQLSIGLYSNKPSLSCKAIKDSRGIEKRYIVGTSSGALYRDAHNERMTERCVQGFQQQAQSKTIFLIHPHSDNILENHIGILDAEKSFINQNNEWITYWKLWDQNDTGSIPTRNIEKSIDFFNQINGNPPYSKPTVIKQLSIQGTLDETKDIINTLQGRDIDWVELDAVSVVTKGAYPQGDITIAEKIFKQYDNYMNTKQTITIEKVSSLRDKVRESNSTSDFLVETAKLDEALKLLLEDIASDETLTPEMKEKECKRVLNEYTNETLSNYKSINFNLQEGEDEMPRKRKEEEVNPEETSVKEEVDVTTEEKQLFNKEEFLKELENVMQKYKADETTDQPSEPMQKDAPDQIQVLQELLATIQEKIAQLGGNSELVEQKSKTTKEDEGQEETVTEKEDDGFKVDGVIDSGEANASTPDNQPNTSAKPSEQLDDSLDLDQIINELEKRAGRKLSATAKQEIIALKKQSILPKEVRSEIELLKRENISLRKSLNELDEKVRGLVDGLNEFNGSQVSNVAKQEVSKPMNTSVDINVLEEIVKSFKSKQAEPKKEVFDPKKLFRNTLEQFKG